MRLADFIRGHAEGIAKEWEAFARTCEPAAATMGVAQLRDHILPLLRFVADDLETPQTRFEQSEKALGRQPATATGDSEAEKHGALRVIDCFTVDQVVGEFRALRASILRLWEKHHPRVAEVELAQIVRFDEAIDQMLAESVARHGELEATARERSNKRDAFLATLSHELRGPLGALSNAANTIAMIAATDSSLAPGTAIMVRQTRHLSRLLNDLLDVARIDSDRIQLQLAATDIRECVQDAVEANREVLTQKRHVLTLRMPDTPLVCEVDCTRIVQIVSNLLNNAAKYSPAGSNVEVALTRDEEHVTISVKDNGSGIEPSRLPHIFAPFFANHEENLGKSGLGIGLSLARRLVELHGGGIVAKSEGPGRGAEFRATIPLRPNTSQHGAA